MEKSEVSGTDTPTIRQAIHRPRQASLAFSPRSNGEKRKDFRRGKYDVRSYTRSSARRISVGGGGTRGRNNRCHRRRTGKFHRFGEIFAGLLPIPVDFSSTEQTDGSLYSPTAAFLTFWLHSSDGRAPSEWISPRLNLFQWPSTSMTPNATPIYVAGSRGYIVDDVFPGEL